MQHECHYEDNQIIFCEYEKGDAFYFIKFGKVKLVRLVKGEEIILDILDQGVFFGEMALIEPELRSATAIAYGDTRLLKFSRENFDQVILENSTLSLKLIKTFINRIWTQQQRLHIYEFSDPEARVVALLLNLKSTQIDQTAKVYISTEELSKWAGLDLQVVKKTTQELISNKLLSVQSDCISILDVSALERILAVQRQVLLNAQ